MDDILLADSSVDTLERFEEVKKVLPCWELQIALKVQTGVSINDKI